MKRKYDETITTKTDIERKGNSSCNESGERERVVCCLAFNNSKHNDIIRTSNYREALSNMNKNNFKIMSVAKEEPYESTASHLGGKDLHLEANFKSERGWRKILNYKGVFGIFLDYFFFQPGSDYVISYGIPEWFKAGGFVEAFFKKKDTGFFILPISTEVLKYYYNNEDTLKKVFLKEKISTSFISQKDCKKKLFFVTEDVKISSSLVDKKNTEQQIELYTLEDIAFLVFERENVDDVKLFIKK